MLDEIKKNRDRLGRILWAATDPDLVSGGMFAFDRGVKLSADFGYRVGLQLAIDRLKDQLKNGADRDIQIEIIALTEHQFDVDSMIGLAGDLGGAFDIAELQGRN